MGLSCLRYPRHTTDLHQCSLVVGREPISLDKLRCLSTTARLINSSTHRHYNNRLRSSVAHWSLADPWPPGFLSFRSGCHARSIFVNLSPQNYLLVPGGGDHPKLFLVCGVWPQLDLSVVVFPGTRMGHCPLANFILRCCLGSCTVHAW